MTQSRFQQGNSSYSKCCICGKEVYTGLSYLDKWAYRRGKDFCCSYSCYLKGNKLGRNFTK